MQHLHRGTARDERSLVKRRDDVRTLVVLGVRGGGAEEVGAGMKKGPLV